MKRETRWLNPWFWSGVAVLAITLALLWWFFLLSATYRAVQAAPQGQATGPASSDIVIVEFMDYRCPPCRMLAPVLAAVAQKHPDVRIVYRPVPTHGQESMREAIYALAAGKQGHFMDMHAALMAHEDDVKPEELPALCQQAQIDCVQLKRDMHDRVYMDEILNTRRAAVTLGISQVPTFLVNHKIYQTTQGMPSVESFDRIIAQARGLPAPVPQAPVPQVPVPQVPGAK